MHEVLLAWRIASVPNEPHCIVKKRRQRSRHQRHSISQSKRIEVGGRHLVVAVAIENRWAALPIGQSKRVKIPSRDRAIAVGVAEQAEQTIGWKNLGRIRTFHSHCVGDPHITFTVFDF
jgi:hypothetical protein